LNSQIKLSNTYNRVLHSTPNSDTPAPCAKLDSMGTLYLVGTPIGNLEDMSFRAVRVLKEVGLVASEDTRTTRRLLSHFDIHVPLTSYFEHNKSLKLGNLLEKLKTSDIALVSEAGMPGISDPGYELVLAAHEAGFRVVPVPGSSAAVTALAVSGLPTDRFHYLGFLPRKSSARLKLLQEISSLAATLLAYEAPHRLNGSLHDIISSLGNRRMAVCRELTKVHEEIFRGTVEEAIAHFSEPRGEFSLVVAGTSGAETTSLSGVHELIRELKSEGAGTREALARLIQDTGLPRKQLYRMWLGKDPGQ
jgi:16S rRNA (cytidine1402-2'-O)-methyltransferase